jgi:hypothetical protein
MGDEILYGLDGDVLRTGLTRRDVHPRARHQQRADVRRLGRHPLFQIWCPSASSATGA